MKVAQKLELCAGIATFLSIFLFIYYVDYPSSRGVAELYNDPFHYDWIGAFLVLILPTLLIAISSYFHAFKQSKIAFVVIIALAGILSFLNLLSFLIGSAFEGHPFSGILPGIFAFATIVLALYNALSTFGKDGKFS